MTNLNTPQQNHLLDALPADKYERLFSQLELVPMLLGEVLYESGEELRYVYFPTTCHRIQVLRHGEWRFDRNRCSRQRRHHRNIPFHGRRNHAESCRRAKRGLRLSAAEASIYKALDCPDLGRHDRTLQYLLLRYTQALITQMAQSAVCNRHHILVPATLPLAPAKPGPALIERD